MKAFRGIQFCLYVLLPLLLLAACNFQNHVISFFNYDETVNMILSYWLDDRERWEQDFKNLVRTFAWNELK